MEGYVSGIFEDTEVAVDAARKAYDVLSTFTLKDRIELIRKLRKSLLPRVEEFASLEKEETCMGVYRDKVTQIRAAILGTPGANYVNVGASSDEEGLVVDEYFPYGVACVIHPVNHPVASIINSTIMLLAAGNSVIHLGPGRAVDTCERVVSAIDSAIYEICGIEHLACSMKTNRQEYNLQLMQHPDVSLVVVTGGNEIARKTFGLKKRVIIAGAANPVAIVDEGADLQKAAMDIAEAVSFDNNLLCTSEKSVVVHAGVLEEFLCQLVFEHALLLGKEDIEKLENVVFNPENEVNRIVVGQSVPKLLDLAGIAYDHSMDYRLIAFLADCTSPFVINEVAAPILPVVAAKDFEEALEMAVMIEQGLSHTASIHSKNIEHLSTASRRMRTAIFIKNGSTLYGAGLKGNGHVTFTIANVSGEGVVSPKTFVRSRKCILLASFERV
ncbi:MAG: aldehyde dehydrogenase [Lachnospiraceae bacterium]|nr:aldehyde dehydrogenase [Lachnospiraceae bacterium]